MVRWDDEQYVAGRCCSVSTVRFDSIVESGVIVIVIVILVLVLAHGEHHHLLGRYRNKVQCRRGTLFQVKSLRRDACKGCMQGMHGRLRDTSDMSRAELNGAGQGRAGQQNRKRYTHNLSQMDPPKH